MKKIILILGCLFMVPALGAAQSINKNTLLKNMSAKKKAEMAKWFQQYNQAPVLFEEFKKLHKAAEVKKDPKEYLQKAKEKIKAEMLAKKQNKKIFKHAECRLASWSKFSFAQGCQIWAHQYEQYDQPSGKWIKFGPITEGAKIDPRQLITKKEAKAARRALMETQPPVNNVQNKTASQAPDASHLSAQKPSKDQKTQDTVLH